MQSLPCNLFGEQRGAARRFPFRNHHNQNNLSNLIPVAHRRRHGIRPNLVTELDRSLNDHELVKVRARVADRDLRDEILDELAKATGSELVQRLGHVALYYRLRNDKPGILLPG